ncbi:DUF4760 domain-containing protein [Kordiimonas sp. SCSIO 12603]|uniref:DUF4760 domain-containing protein n=1 Tax=Kordiimonas sp. SCSIO 12603 TaxID=2829596 RepID=UPI00210482ED|nr:DUF4760 domain-containing protein [Kordiimonas sp. SCSIO 12603]UTW59299.1 DUF4760 domain-containing protein [Kordiimonas sp. SCSIO 12603]
MSGSIPYIDMLEVINAVSNLMIAYGVFFFLYFSRRQEKREKVEFASRYIQQWNTPDFFHITSRLFSFENIEFLRALNPESYEDFRSNNKVGFDDIVTTLNFIEEMAQAIESNLADEHTLRKYFQRSLIETYLILENFIEITRMFRNHPTAYRSTERLMGQWAFSKSVAGGK